MVMAAVGRGGRRPAVGRWWPGQRKGNREEGTEQGKGGRGCGLRMVEEGEGQSVFAREMKQGSVFILHVVHPPLLNNQNLSLVHLINLAKSHLISCQIIIS